MEDYHRFEQVLQAKGFQHDTSQGAPTCRWLFEDIEVDVMPTDPRYLGYSNEWHRQGIGHVMSYTLDDGQEIKLLDTAYLIASKLEAIKGRGLRDLRISIDFDDVVFVLLDRASMLDEILKVDEPVRKYISHSFGELLRMDIIDEAISVVLPPGEPSGTGQRVKQKMEALAEA